MSMAFGRFESTPYIRSRVFESLLAFQTQVNDPDTVFFSRRIRIFWTSQENSGLIAEAFVWVS
jgi:hypothetical protein